MQHRVQVGFSQKLFKPVPGGHPDPDGFHLAIVARALRLVLDRWMCHEVGLFWDFGSLHQPPRVQDQEELFKQGLQASTQSTVLPGSQLTYRGSLSRYNSFSLAMPFQMFLFSIAPPERRQCEFESPPLDAARGFHDCLSLCAVLQNERYPG